MFWKIKGGRIERVKETNFTDEEKLEEDLEDWIKRDPQILGEPLLIIGQQKIFPGVGDKLDLLGIDPEGNSVIVEIKRHKVKDPYDIQSLRYASYVSQWDHEAFEETANDFYRRKENRNLIKIYLDDEEAEYEKFTQVVDQFCDEGYELNKDQRIILVGPGVSDKVMTLLMWLEKKGLNIKVIDITLIKDDEDIYLTSKTLLPFPKPEELMVGGKSSGAEPWKVDGQKWHLEKRCNNETAELLTNLVALFEDLDGVDGISWDQKFYVAANVNKKNWTTLTTWPNQINVRILTEQGYFDKGTVAEKVRIKEEKIGIEEKRKWHRLEIKLSPKDKFDIEGLKELAKDALTHYISVLGRGK
jgi:hypothetical protein